jgi:type II secretory pathway pseudopilin PulG
MNGRKGTFTLLELMLTLGILLILAGITVPRLRNSLESSRFATAVDDTSLFLDYAKSQSILKTAVLFISIDPGEHLLLLTQGSQEENLLIKKLALPVPIAVVSDTDRIAFYPDGTLHEFSLTLSDKRKSTRIFSNGFDGKIIVEKKDVFH